MHNEPEKTKKLLLWWTGGLSGSLAVLLFLWWSMAQQCREYHWLDGMILAGVFVGYCGATAIWNLRCRHLGEPDQAIADKGATASQTTFATAGLAIVAAVVLLSGACFEHGFAA